MGTKNTGPTVTIAQLWTMFALLKNAEWGKSFSVKSANGEFVVDNELAFYALQKELASQAKICMN